MKEFVIRVKTKDAEKCPFCEHDPCICNDIKAKDAKQVLKELDDLIADEQEAVDEYQKAIDSFSEDKSLMYMVHDFEKILDEEKEHIRILEKLKTQYNKEK